MMKKFFAVFGYVSVLSLLVCSMSFAQDVPVPDEFVRDEALSAQALELAKQHFTELRGQLEDIARSLPPDMQSAMKNAIVLVDDKLARLNKIDVYTTNESFPGEAYSDLYNFYEDKLGDIRNVSDEDILFILDVAPGGVIPEDIAKSLKELMDQKKVKAATGGLGKSRVSMMTVYIKHRTQDTFEVAEGTTLVIATDK
jgi:hypothetical protein